MTVIQFPTKHGFSGSARRAEILAEVMRQTVAQPMPMDFGDVFAGILEGLDKSEEEVGGDIYDAIFFAVRMGILECSGHDVRTDAITIGAGTELFTSSRTAAYAFGGRAER